MVEQVVEKPLDSITGLEIFIARKEIYKSGNQNKIINIVEKILEFNKQQKGIGIKILTPKQMFQILPVALAEVKAVDNSEILLNEIKQIVYSLYQ